MRRKKQLEAMVASNTKLHANSIETLNLMKNDIDGYLAQVDGLVTRKSIKEVQASLIVAQRKMLGGDLKLFRNAMRSAQATISSSTRKRKADTTTQELERASVAEKPAQLILYESAMFDGLAPPGSGYEAKAGHRVGLVPAKRSIDAVSDIKKLPAWKSASKRIEEALCSKTNVVIPVVEDAKNRRITKVLRLAWDSTYMEVSALPEEDWAPQIYQKQFFGLSKNNYFINLPPFASIEARLCLQGSETIFGVRRETCPGSDLKEQRDWLANCSQADFSQVMARSGFKVLNDGSSLVIIPSGYICIYCSGDDGCQGLRWSVACEEGDNAQRVMAGLRHFLEAYPSLKGTAKGYSPFLSFLEAD